MAAAPNRPLVLTADEIAVACTILVSPGSELLVHDDARAALAGLRDAGALGDDGRLVAPAARVIGVITGAQLRLELRVCQVEGVVVEHRAWADERHAVVARLSTAGFELSRVRWHNLPAAVALLLGLDRAGERAVARDREPIDVAPGALLAAGKLMRSGDRPAARASLAGGGGGATVDAALELAASLHAACSVASSWRTPEGQLHVGRLVALDGGASGWWELEPDASTVRLRPTDPEALWVGLHALLPR